jgi:hypothetical protein
MFILLHVLTGQLGFICSTVDRALSFFYKFNCWANRYFEEGKTMHRPINLINIEQSLKKIVQKCNRPVSKYRILVEHMIGDLKKNITHSELCGDIRGGRN